MPKTFGKRSPINFLGLFSSLSDDELFPVAMSLANDHSLVKFFDDPLFSFYLSKAFRICDDHNVLSDFFKSLKFESKHGSPLKYCKHLVNNYNKRVEHGFRLEVCYGY